MFGQPWCWLNPLSTSTRTGLTCRPRQCWTTWPARVGGVHWTTPTNFSLDNPYHMYGSASGQMNPHLAPTIQRLMCVSLLAVNLGGVSDYTFTPLVLYYHYITITRYVHCLRQLLLHSICFNSSHVSFHHITPAL